METNLLVRPKTIREALADGTLVDMSEEGKKAFLRCKLFMSPSLVEKSRAVSKSELHNYLSLVAYLHNHESRYDIFGALDAGDRYRILEPNEEFGLVLLIIEKDLNLVRTSENYKQLTM